MNDFDKNNYVVVKKAIDKELVTFLYNYFLVKKQVYDTCREFNYISPYETLLGYYEGENEQIPHTYSCYSDIAMETLMLRCQPVMEKATKLKLYPAYTYARIYKKGDELKRHKDRFSCEISTTLNLGGNDWPIYLEPSGKENKKGKKINLKPGDMLIYKGCEAKHWREPYQGEAQVQAHLHYVDIATEAYRPYVLDGRSRLGEKHPNTIGQE